MSEREQLRTAIRNMADAMSACNKYIDAIAHSVRAWPPESPMNIKRYHPTVTDLGDDMQVDMKEELEGEWVRYEDIKHLLEDADHDTSRSI